MIGVEHIIAKVTALRQEAATEALASPNRKRPEFGYGEAVGRDAAFALVLDGINAMIEADAKEEED